MVNKADKRGVVLIFGGLNIGMLTYEVNFCVEKMGVKQLSILLHDPHQRRCNVMNPSHTSIQYCGMHRR